jgi:hypothetical protein
LLRAGRFARQGPLQEQGLPDVAIGKTPSSAVSSSSLGSRC